MKIKELKKVEFNKKNFSLKKIKDNFFNFLLNKFGAIFMIIFLAVSLIGGVVIYRYIFNSSWSEDEKNAYENQLKDNRIVFDEEKFENIIMKIEERRKSKKESLVVLRDIFKNDTVKE